MAGELITKNEIINESWMYTVSANANGRMSCLVVVLPMSAASFSSSSRDSSHYHLRGFPHANASSRRP
jgi:hypothetical protein